MTQISPRTSKQTRWVATLAAAALTATLTPAVTAQAVEVSGPGLGDGTRVTQAEYDYKTAIRETAYVESTVDGDKDGKLDKIAADIIRPAESASGLKVPVIMVASPYFARPKATAKSGSRLLEPALDDDYKDLEDDGTPSKFPDWYDNYFVPRGYAVVLVDLPGTRASEGCLTSGGRGETLGAKAVVDWVGGRAKAVNKAGQAVAANWSTGKVGMIGRSWRGSPPSAVATEDVPNLKTIVPIAAVGSWYDYMRHNGIVRQPDWPRYVAARWGSSRLVDPNECKPVWDKVAADSAEDTGNYNAFWAERDYAKDAAKVKASVLMVHGLNDWNVLSRMGHQYWQGLAPGTPRKLWLHQAAHVDPIQVRPTEWVNTLHRWFDFWLKDIDNGIMTEPQVDLEQSPGKWKTAAAWPAPGATTQRYWFAPPAKEGGPGTLVGSPPGPPGVGFQQSFTDNLTDGQDALTANPEQKKDNRLVFLGQALTRDTRLSGVADVHLRASLSSGSGPLSAMLVDYGPGDHLAHSADRGESGLLADGEQCIGQGDAVDTGCIWKARPNIQSKPYEIVAEGWADADHRESRDRITPVVPGTTYDFKWKLQPEDYVFKAGHRIGVVVTATDCTDLWAACEAAAAGNPPYPAAKVNVTLAASSIGLPIAPADAG